MPLLNPARPSGRPDTECRAGDGVQQDSLRPHRSEAGRRDQSLPGSQPANCAFTPNYTLSVPSNCLDTRSKTDVANNFDFRVDHHFSDKNTVFGRAYMMWDTDTANRRRNHIGHTEPVSHVEHRRRVGPHLHSQPDSGSCAAASMPGRWWSTRPIRKASLPKPAGFSNLSATAGFYLTPSGYPGTIGNVGPEHRANPEHDISGAMTWSHGKHNIRFGGEYPVREPPGDQPVRAVQLQHRPDVPDQRLRAFRLRQQSGNALASMLLDLPSGADGERAAV